MNKPADLPQGSRARRSGCPWMGIGVFLGAVLFSAALLPGQIRPDQPIRDYRLPFFDEQGRRLWEMRGREGLLLGDDSIRLRESRITIFPAATQRPGETIVSSTSAHLFPETREAQGTEGVSLQHPLGEGEARTWTYREVDRILTLEGNVTLHLPQALRALPEREGRLLP